MERCRDRGARNGRGATGSLRRLPRAPARAGARRLTQSAKESIMSTTLIRNADWAIAWERNASRHVYSRHRCRLRRRRITHVGPGFAGTADATVDGRGLMVMPGLVNMHSHLGHEPAYRGIREEHGVANMYMSSSSSAARRSMSPTLSCARPAPKSPSARCSRAALRRCATSRRSTTGGPTSLARAASARFWRRVSPPHAGSSNDLRSGSIGTSRRARALRGGARARRRAVAASLRSPVRRDLADADRELFGRSAARQLEPRPGSQASLHPARRARRARVIGDGQAPRHDADPGGQDIGLLGPTHRHRPCHLPDTHSWIRWHTKNDIRLLAESGCSVAHCPTPFARYGIMESFGDYVRAGINMGIGTDTTPHNMLEEIRKAGIRAHRARATSTPCRPACCMPQPSAAPRR